MPFGLTLLSLGVVFVLIFKIILNNIVIMQIHVVIRRVNPALKIDLVQVGYLKDNQFVSISLDALADTPLPSFLERSSISDSLYIDHSKLCNLVAVCVSSPAFQIEFFDNTFILMFDCNLDDNEIAKKEEGKGH